MSLVHGCAHVGGLYPTSANFLTEGFNKIRDMGFASVKLWLSPTYATDYPNQTGFGSPTTLTQLAQSTPFATVLGDATIKTYFLNTWTFASGANSQWIQGMTPPLYPSLFANERAEIQALVTHLLTTYAGTGKTFIIQNWEGDWQLLGSFTPTDYIAPYVGEWCAGFHRERRIAIDTARQASTATGVRVLLGHELNRSLDGNRRVHKDVLTQFKPDMIALSSYESINTWGSSVAEAQSNVRTLLRRVVEKVRHYCPGVPVYCGEFGWPEDELPGWLGVDDLLDAFLDESESLGLTHALYWQVWDNASPYRGYALYDNTDTLTGAGTYYQNLLRT